MFTKKVIIKWQRDGYINSNANDRNESDAAALAELDAKTAEMVGAGKMSADVIVGGVGTTILSARLVTDQAAAEEWISFIDTFATKYGFVKISSEIKSVA
jgi:hypothetical protein